MKLGIVYKNGRMINHRSLTKVLLNPILRYVGINIASVIKDNKVSHMIIAKCERTKNIVWDFKCLNLDYDYIEKKRIII